MKSVGQTIFSFFEDYLKAQKGLRPGSVRSYRDTLKLFLAYVAGSHGWSFRTCLHSEPSTSLTRWRSSVGTE